MAIPRHPCRDSFEAITNAKICSPLQGLQSISHLFEAGQTTKNPWSKVETTTKSTVVTGCLVLEQGFLWHDSTKADSFHHTRTQPIQINRNARFHNYYARDRECCCHLKNTINIIYIYTFIYVHIILIDIYSLIVCIDLE